MIQYHDITVVVQGPVSSYRERPQEEGITQRCLHSIRQHLPGSKIILSTWQGQDISKLDFDKLVLNPDPGGNIVSYDSSGKPRYLNHNRQIVSTINGLRKVNTPFAMKLRSDNTLTGTGFIDLHQRFRHRSNNLKWLNHRVVLINTFSRKYAKGYRVAFHPSDFFSFGSREDLVNLWDIPLFEDLQPDELHLKSNHAFYPAVPEYERDPCQEIFLRFAWKHKQITLEHLLDADQEKIDLWETILANNFIVAEPERVGVHIGRKFLEEARISRPAGRAGFYNFFEWVALYKKYCDPTHIHQPPFSERWALQRARLYGVWLKRINTLISRRKRKLRYWRAMSSI